VTAAVVDVFVLAHAECCWFFESVYVLRVIGWMAYLKLLVGRVVVRD
jgi:hypothetical protein